MYYDHRNSVGGIEDRGRRRIKFICECEEVRSNRERYNSCCGCSQCNNNRNSRVEFTCRCREVKR